MQIANLEMCSGCGACVAVCPSKAIAFEEDKYGQRFPQINQDKCIDCSLCVRTCPINHNYFLPDNMPTECYALQGKNRKEITGCSSGGVVTVIARHIIKKDGYVFGCKFDERMDLIYVECHTLEDLELIKGSKYVQSDLTNCYPKIKKRLDDGCYVLVVGLPCQIAGLKGFLKKDYERLILIDLICHGTPPVKYLKEHISNLGYPNISSVRFREEKGFILSILDNKQKKVFSVKSICDEFYSGFLQGIIYRENCYKCPYANLRRVSDITVGDFWGLNKKTLTQNFEGAISVGFIHTGKGVNIFKETEDFFVMEKRNVEEALKENGQLREPMKPDIHDRNVFLRYYPKAGFDKAFRKTSQYKTKIIKAKCKAYMVETFVGQRLKELWHRIR